MRAFGIAAAAAALFSSTVLGAANVDPIIIKGNKFFYKTNGTQFYIRGVAYQQDVGTNTTSTDTSQTYSDPLADSAGCTRDLPYLTQLRTNTIRVYAVDPTKNHDDCMNMLANAGIYVILDLSEPSQSINRNTPEWTTDLYSRYTSVVDAFHGYSNVLGFFAGNEVSNAPNNTDASAFVKAAVRDTKAYIKTQGYRTIGVGYAANDDANIRVDLANYFNCGSNQDEAIDFFGYNIYSWCGDSSFTESGYDVRTQEFANYSVPAFFAEYGCNDVEPRPFTEVKALFGSQMNDVWSGGIVYMYFQEANNYGLVSVGSSGSVTKRPDFTNYSKQIASVTVTGVNAASFTPTNTVPASCPAVTATGSSTWLAKGTPLPPVANEQLCSCMMSSLSCIVSPSVDSTDYGDLFGVVCGLENGEACAGIQHNATTGTYGAYGMCNSTEQISFVLNQYVKLQNNAASACDFSGSATAVSSAKATGNCAALMSQAGTAGTGTITASATGSGAATATSSKGAGSAVTVSTFDFGVLHLGAYLVGAALTGAGMILL